MKLNSIEIEDKNQIYSLYLHLDKSIHKARNEYKRIRQLREADAPSPSTIRRIVAELDEQGHLEVPSPSKNSGAPIPAEVKRKEMPEHFNGERTNITKAVLRKVSGSVVESEPKSKPMNRRSAFGFFVTVCYDTHKTNFPNNRINYEEMSRRCAEQWANMDPKDMKAFQSMADADRSRYETEMKEYVSIGQISKPRRLKPCTTLEVTERPRKRFTAFALFCMHNRIRVKDMVKNKHPIFVTVQLGKAWKKLPNEQKAKYEAHADKDKIRYTREMLEYRKKHRGMKPAQLPNVRGDDAGGYDSEVLLSRARGVIFTEKPEVPVTQFEGFCMNMRGVVSSVFPDVHGRDLAEKLAEYWESLPNSMKNVYEKIAKEDKARYLREIQAQKWEFRPENVHYPGRNSASSPSKVRNRPRQSKENGKLLKPKQPLTAFTYFCRDTKFDDREFKTESAVERLQRQWTTTIDSHDRARYMVLEHTDLIRYSIEMGAYLQAGGNEDDGSEPEESESDEIEMITIDDSDHDGADIEVEQRPRIEGQPVNSEHYTFF